jgi:hypothetical protein
MGKKTRWMRARDACVRGCPFDGVTGRPRLGAVGGWETSPYVVPRLCIGTTWPQSAVIDRCFPGRYVPPYGIYKGRGEPPSSPARLWLYYVPINGAMYKGAADNDRSNASVSSHG